MTEKKNILKWVIVDLEKALHFLADKLHDSEAIKEILLSLGLKWDRDESSLPVIPNSSLDSINQYTSKSEEDIDIEAFASVMTDIINVTNAIEDSINVISTLVNNGDDSEVALEITDLLMQLALVEYLRLRIKTSDGPYPKYPSWYPFLKVPDFYEELSGSSGDIFGLYAIWQLLEKLFKSLDIETEEEAKLLTDFIFLGLGALSFKISKLRNNIKIIYGFDPSPDSTSPVADQISQRTLTLSLTDKGKVAEEADLAVTYYLSLAIKTKSQGGGPEVWISGTGNSEIELGNDWTLSIFAEGIPELDGRIEIKFEKGGEQTRWIIGDTKGTRLEIGSLSFTIEGSVAENDLDFKISAEDCAFVLAKGDNFISKILPDNGITGNFDFGIGYSIQKKLYIDGGSGLSVLLPLHATLTNSQKNNIILNSFFLKGGNNDTDNGFSLETSIGFTVSILGISATVERIGILQNFTLPGDTVKLNNARYSIDFKPPTGVGLSFNNGILKGGGFLYLDLDKGEYTGALELSFEAFDTGFNLKAIGIINTKVPGIEDYSLLIIITTEFNPPIWQIVKGAGGLIGLNRAINIGVLREGIKTNAIKSILFPQDVVANIGRIISDIKQVFPPQPDQIVVGPMVELGWGTDKIITAEVGILFSSNIVIIGVLRVEFPNHEKPLTLIQVNFLGVIDFKNKFISFDAALYDSRLLAFTLTGDMAFRLSWGDPSMFIVSVGGFHPAFHDAPADLQHMNRFTISLLSGENPRITVHGYIAITSNTFQFGAKAELYAAKGSFNIYGFIGLDVLLRFDFTFIADFEAGVALRHNTSVIMGIHVSGELSGPTPWHVQGKASISFFFFSISVPFNVTWGNLPDELVIEKADILALLVKEINNSYNWKADIPRYNNLHVTVKKIELPAEQSENVIIHPFGVLTFSERLVPLEFTIDKFGDQLPKDANIFRIKAADADLVTEAVNEQFAPANFFNKTDSEKLSSPSFEHLPAGFKITGSSALHAPKPLTKDVNYELTYLSEKRAKGTEPYKFGQQLFKATTRGSAVAKSPLSFTKNRTSPNAPEAVLIQEHEFAIANVSDMRLHNNSLVAGSYVEATQIYNDLITKQPELKEQVQIVSQHELNMN